MTIVMPTYERLEFALRNMLFWSGKKVQLLVLDGSKRKISDKDLEKFSDNIKYYHLPISMAERLKFAKNLIFTEYVSLLGDDEFLLPSGIISCINEIEKYDLVACLGRSLYFNFKDGKILAEPLNHEPGSPWHPGFKKYSLLQNNPAVRVKYHMNPYLGTTFYAVTKKNVWINTINAYQNMQSSADCPEVALELSNSFQGKSKVVDNLMWLRSGENEPMLLYGEKEDYISFGKWFDDSRFELEHQIFINTIVDAVYIDEQQCSKSQIYKIIESGCYAFSLFERTRRFDLRAWIVNMHLGFKPMRYLIIKRFNQLMQKIGVYRSEEYGLNISNPDLLEMAAVWKKNGIGVDFKEVTEINDLLLKFHNQPK
jgi:glycosyltransferase domain-containing protein